MCKHSKKWEKILLEILLAWKNSQARLPGTWEGSNRDFKRKINATSHDRRFQGCLAPGRGKLPMAMQGPDPPSCIQTILFCVSMALQFLGDSFCPSPGCTRMIQEDGDERGSAPRKEVQVYLQETSPTFYFWEFNASFTNR